MFNKTNLSSYNSLLVNNSANLVDTSNNATCYTNAKIINEFFQSDFPVENN